MKEGHRKLALCPSTSTSSPSPPPPLLSSSFLFSLPLASFSRMAFDSPLHTIPTQRRSYANTSDLEMASMEEGTHRPRAGPSSPPRSNPQRVLAMNPRDMGDLFASLESPDGEFFRVSVYRGEVEVARKGREREEGGARVERASSTFSFAASSTSVLDVYGAGKALRMLKGIVWDLRYPRTSSSNEKRALLLPLRSGGRPLRSLELTCPTVRAVRTSFRSAIDRQSPSS